jgi:hypothetical protein
VKSYAGWMKPTNVTYRPTDRSLLVTDRHSRSLDRSAIWSLVDCRKPKNRQKINLSQG